VSAEKRLITEGDAVQPSWSPNGSRIAYVAGFGQGGERDILTIDALGGEAVTVTDDAHQDFNPVWSPDGEYLYFSSNRGGNMNIWHVPIEEESGAVLGPPERVTTGAGYRSSLSFSVDGRKLAYVESSYQSNIWKAAFDLASGEVTGEPIPITRGSRSTWHFDVSPDGNWLAYIDQRDVFLSRSDGTGQRRLTNDLYNDLMPRWSPDGNRIAHYSTRSGNYEIWIINADGSELRQLTWVGRTVGYPTWSPDGNQMVYFNPAELTTHIFYPHKPWNEQTPVVLPPLGDGKGFAAQSWSPDERRLAGYSHEPSMSNPAIIIYSLETQQYQQLNAFDTAVPRWLSDSRRVLFAGRGSIYLADIETEEVREILSLSPDTLSNPCPSPDNRWFFFNRRQREADIWMLTLN
jgi:Tol biopolymer transport system component